MTFAVTGQVLPHAASPNNWGQLYWRDMVTGDTGLVSGKADDATAGNGRIDPPDAPTTENDMSRNGRYIAFTSQSCELDPDDVCGVSNVQDVFLYDRTNDEIARVSETVSNGIGGRGTSGKAHVSQCGRYVAFESTSKNLEAVANYDTTALSDCPGGSPELNFGRTNIFVLDRGDFDLAVDPDPQNNHPAAKIEWISIGWRVGGAANRCFEPQKACDFPTMSDDGGRVAFRSRANNLVPGVDLLDFFAEEVPFQVYVWDRATSAITLVSQDWSSATLSPGDDLSNQPEISGDGRYVAFVTLAENLLPFPGDSNGYADVVVVDLDEQPTPTVQRVSVREDGTAWPDDILSTVAKNPAISDRGRFVNYFYGLDPEKLHNSLPVCEYIPDSVGGEGLIWDRNIPASTFVQKAPDGAGFKQANGSISLPSAFSDGGEYLVYSSQSDDLPLAAGELADTNGRDMNGNPIFPTCKVTQGTAVDPCNAPALLPCNDLTGVCPCAKEGQDVYRRRIWNQAP